MKSFNLYNIKVFENSGDIELKPLTIFIGKNSSGKSSLGRFLIVLKQTLLSLKVSPLVFYDEDKNFIDYGEFKDIVNNYETNKEIGFSITLDSTLLTRIENYLYTFLAKEENMEDTFDEKAHEVDLLKKYLNAVNTIKISVYLKHTDNKLVITNFKCISGESNLLLELNRKENSDYSIKIFGEDTIYSVSENAVMFENFLPNYRVFDLQYPKWKNEKIIFLYKLFYSLNIYLKEMAKNIEYIGPFREAPQRYYRWDEISPDFVGIKGELAPAILVNDYKSDKKIIDLISDWLQKSLNVELSVDDSGSSYSIMIKDTKNHGIESNLMDVGYGLAQLIPILVQIFHRKINLSKGSSSITLVEQPELHLHPDAQAALTDLFLEASSKNNRYIVETHSENMILRLRRRVVENPEIKDMIALYYIEKKSNGNSEVVRLKIDEKGDIPNWPKDLLSEDYYELLEIKKAANDGDKDKRGEFTW